MATGLDIITGALEEIGYKAAETPIESEDSKLALIKLNDMMSAWEASGIFLGFVTIKEESDTVRIPRWAEDAVKVNLAGKLAAPFKTSITPELSASIKAANDLLLRTVVGPLDVEYPSTLPMGSGNRCYEDEDTFFSQNDKENF